MKYVTTIILTFVLSLNAQTNISRISIDFGIIRNYQNDFGNDKLYAFYPEVKIGGQLLTKYFEWELFTSYWGDGVTNAFQLKYAATYSYNNITVGSKLCFYPCKVFEDFFWPLYLTSGISYHNVNEKYIGGSDFVGNHKNSNTFRLVTFDIGIGVYLQALEKLRFRIDTIAFIPFKDDNRLYNFGKVGTVKLGFDYFFNNE